MKELLKSSNSAVWALLQERNALLRERAQLLGHEINFSEYNLLEQHESLRPYTISPWGHVLIYRSKQPPWAIYPADRRPVDTGTQTNDADTTLVKIEPETKEKSSDNGDNK
ncbi:hypothetical protein EI94DRAFT_1796198 [Lactarius quietus]|nr:hypothetical protein EI94DRAFT_1796198 [Lactarius quietus]